MFCTNCGHKNDEHAKFCEDCGKPMQDEPTTQSLNQAPPPVAPTTKTGNKKSRPIVISALILVVCFAAGGIWYFQSQDKSPMSSKTEGESFNLVEESEETSREETQEKAKKKPTKESTEEIEEKNDTKTVKNKQALRMQISQIDNSAFPTMTLYTQIKDRNNQTIADIKKDTFEVKEIGPDGKEQNLAIKDILPVEESTEMNINLVLDQSGSMDEDNKINNAKVAASKFIDEILSNQNNHVEITSFDSYVHNVQAFSSDNQKLKQAIDSIELGDQTALYDALYDALIQTNQTTGARFVIAFTDGDENASLHSENEVIELSKQTGIPVYIIGIGSDINAAYLESFTASCNGDYYSAEVEDLSTVLLDIYEDIYSQQKDLYKVTYTSKANDKLDQYYTVSVSAAKKSAFNGQAKLEYMPQDNIAAIDNRNILDIIEAKTDVENVAVAIVDLKTNVEFRVGNARQSYVASGFYAPIYTVASTVDQDVADQMMKTMDNDAGNTLIDEFGGLSSVTDALSDQGYTQTTFNRKFGDVKASEAGNENYTSAVDSAKILRDIYDNDGYKNMNWDLTKDGIVLPANVKTYAHRGQGIGAAYNVFAIIETDDVKYGIAIMTAHTGSNNKEAQAVAVPMISDILAEVHKGMTGH